MSETSEQDKRAAEDARLRAAGYYDMSMARNGEFWCHVRDDIRGHRSVLLDRVSVAESYDGPAREEISDAQRADQAIEDGRNLAEIVKAAARLFDYARVADGALDIFRELYGREPVRWPVAEPEGLDAATLREVLAEEPSTSRRVVSARVSAIGELVCDLVAEAHEADAGAIEERDALRAARIAYASEFDGDVGSVHENIRRLKARCAELEARLVEAK